MAPSFSLGIVMGLFSSKTVITVGTSVVRAVDDSTLPNSVRSGATKGLFSGDGQFIENVLEDITASLGVTARRFYNYGKNKYPYGLPSGAVLESQSGSVVMQQEIEKLNGQSATVDYYHFGVFNNLHVGWVKLVAEHGYNPVNNQIDSLTAQKGHPVFLTNMAVVVTEASLMELENGSLEQWGAPANSGSQVTGNPVYDEALRKVNALKPPILFELDDAAAEDYLRVEYEWLVPTTKVVEGVTVPDTMKMKDSFRMNLYGYDVEAEYHQTRYTLADGTVHYFIYKQDSGIYPELDALYDPKYAGNGSYMPFTYFRYEKKNGAADPQSDWCKHSRRMLKTINMEFEEVANAINENPDIGDVEQAMMVFAVPANTKNQIEMQYLFDYFKQLKAITKTASPNNEQDFGTVLTSGLQNSIVVQDKRFKMALGFRNITTKLVVGNIGKIGTYSSGYAEQTDTEEGKNVATGGKVLWSSRQHNHYYRKQISATVYEEVRVFNLKMTYYIFQQYTAVGDEEDAILLIPLDVSITKKYSLPKREELYSRSMHYVFNSKIVTKVKWYQQGWFRIFMLIVAIVITVLSVGSAWQSIGAALAIGTITVGAVVYMLAVGLLKYILISYALKLFVRIVGPEFAFLVAIVALAYGVYDASQTGSLAGAPWAKDLLQVSTGLTRAINMELQQDFGKLSAEADEFKEFVDAETARLETAKDLLGENNWLYPIIVFGENPSEFYNRTVHSGNVGVQGLDAVAQFVDIALTLPTITETL